MTTVGSLPRFPPARLAAAIQPLFPQRPEPAVRVGWQGILTGLVAVLAGTVIVVLRQPGAGALDTVWAEDGTVFLADAVNRSPLDALATSYAGYYHLLPRLLAQVAVL